MKILEKAIETYGKDMQLTVLPNGLKKGEMNDGKRKEGN